MQITKTKGQTVDEWRSCCFRLDKRCVMFSVQTVIGISLLTFCAYRLATEPDCDRAAPYWGLIGSIVGFFFNKLSMGSSSGGTRSAYNGGEVRNSDTNRRIDSGSRYAPSPVVINVP